MADVVDAATEAQILEARAKLRARIGDVQKLGGKRVSTHAARQRAQQQQQHQQTNASSGTSSAGSLAFQTAVEEKKLHSALKKVPFSTTPVEEVNIYRDDGTCIHFESPKVQIAPQHNTTIITGVHDERQGVPSGISADVLAKLQQMISQNPRVLESLKQPIGGTTIAPPLVEDFESYALGQEGEQSSPKIDEVVESDTDQA